MRPLGLVLLSVSMLILAAAGSSLSATAQTTPAETKGAGKTVLDGVYTAAQATRGSERFAMHCSSCHAKDLSGINGPALKGDAFIETWREHSLDALVDHMKTMPPRQEPLGEGVYLDILAHMLEMNTFPAGAEDLKAGAIDAIRFVGKNGPAATPDFALVQVVGCLTQNADRTWSLTNASEPARIRNAEKPSMQELNARAVKPLGVHSFHLLYPESFSPVFHVDLYKGHKMYGKGYLIRNPGDERLSVTWLETVASTCTQ